MSTQFSNEIILECKKRLLQMRAEILNRVRTSHMEFHSLEKGRGDEVDQAVEVLAENQFVTIQRRMREQLLEIEVALARIENGTFGICEETEEPIEKERLLAIPYTRLSIEGAEIREAVNHRFAK